MLYIGKRGIKLAFACISISMLATAQDVESISKAFPNSLAVTTKYIKELKLSIENNQPIAKSTQQVEMIMLDDKANGIYNKYSVYHGSFDELTNLEAYTKVLDGGKYKKIKVTETKTKNSESSSVFYDDVKETVFNFPSLTKGSIASVEYTQKHKDIHMLSPFYFFSYTPILYSEYTVTYPANMNIQYILKNNEKGTIQVKEDNKGRQRSITFFASNIPDKERYGNGPAISYYEPHVILYVASYTNDNNEEVAVYKTMQDFYKWNYSFLKGINEEQSEVIKSLADSLTAKLSSPMDKAKAIYQWVQQHIKYVAFEDGLEGFIPRQAKDVCTKRYGDCKDMASLITTLLRVSGLKAYYTWIGTRSIAYDYDEVHLPITDNHMISTVNIGNEWIFLDGTDPNCIFGFPSMSIQAKQALVAIDADNYKIIRVPEVEANKNRISDSTFVNINGNGIKGNISIHYSGYFGSEMYNQLLYKDPKDVKDYVKYKTSKASNKFILGEYAVNPTNKEQKSINIKADFEVPDYGKKIGDEIYINLNLEKPFSNFNIDTSKRKVAYDNEHKYVIEQYTILSIPSDYAVTFVPANTTIDKGNYSFQITYKQDKDKLIAKQEIKCNSLWLQPSQFVEWNAVIKQLNAGYKEQVVLQKK